MDFQGLCEFVAEEVNGQPLTFSSVSLDEVTDQFQRKVIKQVKKAYRDISLFSSHWNFLHQRGEILTTVADTTSYQLSTIDSLDYHSLYLLASGSTARLPIYEMAYDIWAQLKQAESTVTGTPLMIVRDRVPDYWILWPTPSGVWTLNGDSKLKLTEFADLDDEPVWDSEYHEMIAWLAIRYLESRARTRDEVVSRLNAAEAQREFNVVWGRFCERYLPRLGSPGPML